MTDTTFVNKETLTDEAWFNDVNAAVYRAIGTGFNGLAPTTPAEVRQNLGLNDVTPISGASLIANNPIGGSLGSTVQEALDLKVNTSDMFADPTHRWNNWDDAATPLNATQTLEFDVGLTQGRDIGGWVAYVSNQAMAVSDDNIVPLVGHGTHEGHYNKFAGAIWGVVTEAWSNPDGGAVLVGSEFATIGQRPNAASAPYMGAVGMNVVFKNRLDVATHPVAPVVDGSLYNMASRAVYITSQARPSGAGAAWSGVGSGWQTAIQIGDPGFGSGLDWEGGDAYPGSDTFKAYTTIIDMTEALMDLAGGTPWFALYRNGETHWGMRFNGMLTGELDTKNLIVNNGGTGYNTGDVGTINGGTGSGAQYYVVATSGGVVTQVAVHGLNTMGGAGYTPATGLATTVVSGTGDGALTIDLAVAVGYFYGANVAVVNPGAGYAVNDIIMMDVGTVPGIVRPQFVVTKVTGGGAIDTVITPSNPYGGLRLLTNEGQVRLTSASQVYSNGHGYTVGTYITAALTGAGAGLTLFVAKVYNDYIIGGERWEYWRMLNPSDPTATGQRQDINDASFPGNDGTFLSIVSAASANVASNGHVIVSFAGTVTLTLPAPENGRMITVKTIQNQAVNSALTNVIPLAGGAPAAAIVPNTAGRWACLVGDGSYWNIQMGG